MKPKKKYRDKVRARLALVREVFENKEQTKIFFKRLTQFEKGSDFHNKMEAFYMLLDQDLPALLDSMDDIPRPINE